jgi:DNA-directed RNA polymerase subunit H (RpoH/RPB5)
MDIKLELFQADELKYNITKHKYYCKHTKVTDSELENLKGLKFQTLRVEDPVARFFAYERGDIIEVEDKKGYISYCIVK